MSIFWRLKTQLGQSHGIYRATDLQKLITEKTGVIISIQQICNLINGKPKTLRLKTMELICSALACELSAFCEVKPTEKRLASPEKLSFKNTPHSKRGIKNFPDPKDYK